ncbi:MULTISPECIES: 2-amino-4-hydroxy-6-hydroxymethyldihydropteridine diphosphokinase [Rhodanobacter]|uniref:2-amino-4-hydroxy-6-hydroxymethyldihydropteridine pyrophosphokinase n=1 Tax=Rhodanobacter denitrificans TaxID=666685 RepID=M4NL14_9GAMM|nr:MULTISPECIES: 2-amino-4-hydroxy-6-hydroxymethyldihydropteridine diphosphokinase [Rhodanobacter]AGG90767.1 2-amino-4-hydroxy-6-hydroxymethyldihydropteridine pyrophosphokinase [Rhodanobacter denitrificans]KZC19585.1 2-amino-4-hydroxy-6-hydroxymethyldihydropteridine pyrophosphokinase [Rhodanobacter denitrificans]UJJ50846.1 2-amino-4-hydroxy-6-hydroxymethyldihydropteridine diphosphokinase [Rhodanobacter denitrificans]UJJ56954.1 2-amino-4-hydroxy-6-hydroxymethyldihydropteridine diphosphokinase [R
MARVYLSLGSNLDPQQYLPAAVRELRERFGELTVSPAYRSKSVGFDGADFINLAVGLDTDLPPEALNDWLHALEDRHGRRRDVPRYADRTLDVDIVFYDALVLDGPGHLQIPRKELRYAFVLRPIADIAPALRHPVSGRSMAELWAAFPAASEPLQVEPLAD